MCLLIRPRRVGELHLFQNRYPLLFLCLIALLPPSVAVAEWIIRTQETSNGTKCFISTWSVSQEPSIEKRDQSVVDILVESLDPLVLSFEINSGLNSSLTFYGVLKIGDEMFVIDFNRSIGSLRDESENEILFKALRSGYDMPVVYGRKDERLIFDNFLIQGIDDKITEAKEKCIFTG
jgi:hypothetical protein